MSTHKNEQKTNAFYGQIIVQRLTKTQVNSLRPGANQRNSFPNVCLFFGIACLSACNACISKNNTHSKNEGLRVK